MRLLAPTLFFSFFARAIAQKVSNVLIFGPPGSREYDAAVELGYNTTLITEDSWANMTTTDFASYDAVIIPDLSTDSVSTFKFLEDSKDTWGPAITGSIIVIGGDPRNHFGTGGAATLISNAVQFATVGNSSADTTGFYLVLSRSYDTVSSATVEALAYFGNFTVRGNLACYDKAHLVASSPALTSLTDASLSNWGCSVHEAFSAYPSTGLGAFQALAIAQDVTGEGSQSFGDGSIGLPYVISRGATPAACGNGVWDATYGEECDDGNAADGDGCSASCKCESGLPTGNGTCKALPTTSTLPLPSEEDPATSYGPVPSSSYVEPPHYGGANTTSSTIPSSSSVPTSDPEWDNVPGYGPPSYGPPSNEPPSYNPPPAAIPPCYTPAQPRPTQHHHKQGGHKQGGHTVTLKPRADTGEVTGAAIASRSVSGIVLAAGVLVLAVFL